MNIKKSLDMALAKRGQTKKEFAESIGVSKESLYACTYQTNVTTATIERLANGLGMKVSEFIALGE